MNSRVAYIRSRDICILEEGLQPCDPGLALFSGWYTPPKSDLNVDSDKRHRRTHVQYYGSYHVTLRREAARCVYVSIIVAR